MPPKSFTVTSQGDKIALSWELYDASGSEPEGIPGLPDSGAL